MPLVQVSPGVVMSASEAPKREVPRQAVPDWVKPVTPICRVKDGNRNEGMLYYMSREGRMFNQNPAVETDNGQFHLCLGMPEEDWDYTVTKNEVQFIKGAQGQSGKVVYSPEERQMIINGTGLYPLNPADFWKALPSIQIRDAESYFTNLVPFSAQGGVVTSLVLPSSTADGNERHWHDASNEYIYMFQRAKARVPAGMLQQQEGSNWCILRGNLQGYQYLFESIKQLANECLESAGLRSPKPLFPLTIYIPNLTREGNIQARSAMAGGNLLQSFKQAESFFTKYAQEVEESRYVWNRMRQEGDKRFRETLSKAICGDYNCYNGW